MSDSTEKPHHLIVFVHGLWGSSSNLARFESVIHHTLDKSDVCNFHTYAPTCFSHFKTYDGIEAIGDYVLVDLMKHIKLLKDEHEIVISQISFIGYSLGGLICRYIIGELYESDFFNNIKPGIFSSIATPHLGCTFYNNSTRFLNFLGSHFLGQTGRDLFLVDGKAGMVYRLSNPEEKYYKGLQLFKSKIIAANAKFDRTVGFYSAFITKYDLLHDWNVIEPRFIDGLPSAYLGENGETVECLVFDFKETKRLPESKSNTASEKYMSRFLILGTIMLFMFPVIFSVSVFASVKSYFRVKLLPKPDIKRLWNSVSTTTLLSIHEDLKSCDSDGYDEEENLEQPQPGISHLTRKVVENGLNILEEDNELQKTVTNNTTSEETQETYNIDTDFTIVYKSKSFVVSSLKERIVSDDLSSLELTKGLKPVPFNQIREEILENLNTIQWTKIAVLQQNLNSHQSIVGRRGFNRTPESIPFLFMYSFLFESTIKEIM